MKAFKVFSGIVGLFVSLPLWYVMIYKILAQIGASESLWVIFWIYMPVSCLVAIILKICEVAGEEK